LYGQISNNTPHEKQRTLPDASQIVSRRLGSTIEDEAQWGAYLDWFVQRIVKMNAVFRPVIQELG
jgi:hypothetical protein